MERWSGEHAWLACPMKLEFEISLVDEQKWGLRRRLL